MLKTIYPMLASGGKSSDKWDDPNWWAEEKIDGCFRGDMLVRMADGTEKPISEVSVGDKVKSYNKEKGLWEDKTVLKVFDNGEGGKWVKVTVSVGKKKIEIICTDNHRFYVKGEWKQAKDLVVGESLLYSF